MRQAITATEIPETTLHKPTISMNTIAAEVIHRRKLSVAGQSRYVSGLVQKAD
jgi:hypothetical protein